MKVSLLDLKAHYDPIREEVMAAVREVVDSHTFILGPTVDSFERRIASYCGVEHAIGVSSGMAYERHGEDARVCLCQERGTSCSMPAT